MESPHPSSTALPHGEAPAPVLRRGSVVIVGIVLLGLAPAAVYHWTRGRLERGYAKELAAAPTTAQGRLAKWYSFGAAMIHRRLADVARFSTDAPWIVVYAQRTPGGLEAWGVDTRDLAVDRLSRLEGMRVVVELPAPRLLGPLRLEGDNARSVPVVEAGATPPDSRQRLRDLALWFLGDMPAALAKDIPGASLEVHVASDGAALPVGAAGSAPVGDPLPVADGR